MIAILLTQRADDWHACIEGDAARWGCGKSVNQAIGDLVNSHQTQFGVDVRWIPVRVVEAQVRIEGEGRKG